VAAISVIALRINLPKFVQFKLPAPIEANLEWTTHSFVQNMIFHYFWYWSENIQICIHFRGSATPIHYSRGVYWHPFPHPWL